MNLEMSPKRAERLLRVACVVALAALSLMVWSVLDPRPIPVVVAMSVGQVLGTLSLLLFFCVVALDLRRANRASAAAAAPPEPAITKE